MRAKVLTRMVIVRLPDVIWVALEKDAEANGRTVSESVRSKLRELQAEAP